MITWNWYLQQRSTQLEGWCWLCDLSPSKLSSKAVLVAFIFNTTGLKGPPAKQNVLNDLSSQCFDKMFVQSPCKISKSGTKALGSSAKFAFVYSSPISSPPTKLNKNYGGEMTLCWVIGPQNSSLVNHLGHFFFWGSLLKACCVNFCCWNFHLCHLFLTLPHLCVELQVCCYSV